MFSLPRTRNGKHKRNTKRMRRTMKRKNFKKQRGGEGKPSEMKSGEWCKKYATATDSHGNSMIRTYSGRGWFSGTVKFTNRDKVKLTVRIAADQKSEAATHYIENEFYGDVKELFDNYAGYIRLGKPVWTYEPGQDCN